MNLGSPESMPNNYGQENREWLSKYIGSRESRLSILEWWYKMTAPPEPSSYATFAQREQARRGKLASTMLFFFLLALLLVALPVGVFSFNPVIVLVTITLLSLVAIAGLLNRYGKSNITGLLIATGLNLGLFLVILTSPGGMGAGSLSLFDLLVFSELFVVSLLPSNWVFFAAGINVTFIIADILFQPRTHYMDALMATPAAYAIIFRPIALHILVTVVLWLWVSSATRAIQRADRAEEIATLQHSIASHEHIIAQQKRLLDHNIQQIIDTHRRVANGDYEARVPIYQDNVLWQIAGPLNNLLARLQQSRRIEQEHQMLLSQLQYARQAEHQLRVITQEISQLVEILHEAKGYQRPLRLIPTGTQLDLLIKELSGHYLKQVEFPTISGKLPNLNSSPGIQNLST